MKDIETEVDVQAMVDAFYGRIQQDDLLGPIFNDVAGVDWSHHLPKMYAFWNGIIRGVPGYQGAPFPPHTVLPVTLAHFERWVGLFHDGRCAVRRRGCDAREKRRREHRAHIRHPARANRSDGGTNAP